MSTQYADRLNPYLDISRGSTFDPDPFDGIMGMGAAPGSFFQSVIDQGLPRELLLTLQ